MGSSLAPICPPCTELRMKWLDSKPSQVLPAFGFAHGSGAPYDVSAAGMRDKASSRHERWRLLVGEQMARIADACRAAGHTAAEPVARVVQLDLLGATGLERAA